MREGDAKDNRPKSSSNQVVRKQSYDAARSTASSKQVPTPLTLMGIALCVIGCIGFYSQTGNIFVVVVLGFFRDGNIFAVGGLGICQGVSSFAVACLGC